MPNNRALCNKSFSAPPFPTRHCVKITKKEILKLIFIIMVKWTHSQYVFSSVAVCVFIENNRFSEITVTVKVQRDPNPPSIWRVFSFYTPKEYTTNQIDRLCRTKSNSFGTSILKTSIISWHGRENLKHEHDSYIGYLFALFTNIGFLAFSRPSVSRWNVSKGTWIADPPRGNKQWIQGK